MSFAPQIVQPRRRARSQQGTKLILLRLAETFDTLPFNSSTAAMRLGTDFLYTAKILSRLKDRYLLTATRIPRIMGGFENSYVISPRGWQKIRYLRNTAFSEFNTFAGNVVQESRRPHEDSGVGVTFDWMRPDWIRGFTQDIIDGVVRPRYLLGGFGTEAEAKAVVAAKSLRYRLLPEKTYSDPLQLQLLILDERFLDYELNSLFFAMVFPPLRHVTTVISRASMLKSLGIVPAEINIPIFAYNAKEFGYSDPEILTVLLIRGGLALKQELETCKAESGKERTRLISDTISLQLSLLKQFKILLQNYKPTEAIDSVETTETKMASLYGTIFDLFKWVCEWTLYNMEEKMRIADKSG